MLQSAYQHIYCHILTVRNQTQLAVVSVVYRWEQTLESQQSQEKSLKVSIKHYPIYKSDMHDFNCSNNFVKLIPFSPEEMHRSMHSKVLWVVVASTIPKNTG